MCEYCEKNKVLKSCNFAGSGEIRIYYKGFEKGIGMLELQGDGMKAKIFKHLYCPRFDILYCPMCRKEAGRVIVLGIILMILLMGMLAILEYNQGCKDTERAYQTRNCDKCANWKTINCPNSSKCFGTVDKPYFKIKEESYDK